MNTIPTARHALLAACLLALATPVLAQHHDHSPPPAPAKAPPAKKKPPADPPAATAPADPHAGHGPPPATTTETPVDHSTMDHSTMDHSTMDHSTMDHGASTNEPRTPIPAVTDADRAAAFPPVAGHAAHDKRVHSYWLVDRLEAWDADEGTGVAWDGMAWIGGDIHKLWLRTEGEGEAGEIHHGSLEVLGGRGVSAWWDVVAGVRHDFGEDPSQTFLAVGVQGLAPYKFEVEATAYVGSGGQTAARLEVEYDTLLTNRLILQWQAEAALFGRDDERRGIGAGLATVEAGMRLRYEINRRFAPYVGLSWERAFGRTADFRRDESEDTTDTRLVLGVRFWF